jgi:tetratricopeptide (TPR) repeat protein
VGFDLPRATVLLRSGTETRLTLPLTVFERTWTRAEHWALVVMPPARLPFTAEELPYLQAVATLEHARRPAEAEQAYTAALKRWSKSLIAHIGLANSRYARADLAGAEAALRQALRFHPDAAAVLNNLAQVLTERGALTEALPLATRATTLEPGNALYRDTLATIRQHIGAGAP